MDSPEKLDADYAAMIASASAAVEAAEPFKTVTWKDGAPVLPKPSILDQVKNIFRRS